MIEQCVYYEPYNWDITIFYEVSCADTDRIMSELKDIGCYGDNLYRARKNIESCSRNNGITFANTSKKEMVVVITQTTSPEQFFNTLIHELHHMAEFIAKADKIPQIGEEISYISGDIALLMFPVVKQLLCPTCRSKIKK